MEKIYKWYLQNRVSKRKEAKTNMKKTGSQSRLIDSCSSKSLILSDLASKNEKAEENAEYEPRINADEDKYAPKFSVRSVRNLSPVYFPNIDSKNSSRKTPATKPSPKTSQETSNQKETNDSKAKIMVIELSNRENVDYKKERMTNLESFSN